MSTPGPEHTEALVRKYAALLNEHKYLDTLSLATPTATWWNSGMKEQNPFAGKQTFEERTRGILNIPEVRDKIEVDIVHVVVDRNGEKAVVEVVAKIQAEDGSYPYRNEIIMIFSVKEGKIDSVKEYMDYYPVQKFLGQKKEADPKA